MLIQYLRNNERVPYGIVVATGINQIGWSLCNPRDIWNRELGMSIAKGRASHIGAIDLWRYSLDDTKGMRMRNVILLVREMKLRAERYFK